MHRSVFLTIVFALTQAQALLPSQYTTPSCGLLGSIVPCVLGQVTDAPSFVFCNQTTNKCQCKPDFSGNATFAAPCRCNAPKQVYFQLGTATPLNSDSILDSALSALQLVPSSWGIVAVRCSDLIGLEAADAKNNLHKAAVFKFFNNTIFPTPQAILRAPQMLLDILSPTARSRISPAGFFNGFDGVVEYFYGFVATPGNIVLSVDIREIAATGNTVAAKANIFIQNTNFATAAGFPPQFYNLSIFGFFTFDSNDKIASIDVSVPNLGKLLDAVAPAPVAALQQGRIQFACQILTMPSPLSTNASGTCGWMDPFNVGPTLAGNPGAQFNACVTFMNSIAFGSYNRVNGNNVVCRFLHALLTPYGPAVHCPHTSISGGGACIEFTYESFFQDEY